MYLKFFFFPQKIPSVTNVMNLYVLRLKETTYVRLKTVFIAMPNGEEKRKQKRNLKNTMSIIQHCLQIAASQKRMKIHRVNVISQSLVTTLQKTQRDKVIKNSRMNLHLNILMAMNILTNLLRIPEELVPNQALFLLIYHCDQRIGGKGEISNVRYKNISRMIFIYKLFLVFIVLLH